jgi:hypothetical protein
MDKIDFVFQDRWIKDETRFWVNAAMPVEDHTAIAYHLISTIAQHYAVLTYFDGNDIYVIGHTDLSKCITVSRDPLLRDDVTAWYSMGNGGLYVKSTPTAIKSALERAMGRNSEEADNWAAKKSCALH